MKGHFSDLGRCDALRDGRRGPEEDEDGEDPGLDVVDLLEDTNPDPEKKKGSKKDNGVEDPSYNLDDLLEEAMMAEEKKDIPEIQRVSELVEGDFEIVDVEEEMGQRDIAIQNYIMDLEADLEEKMKMINEEKKRRKELEGQVEGLRDTLKEEKEETRTDETVQGYLGDLEADFNQKVSELQAEREEKERMERELEELRDRLDRSGVEDEEILRLKEEFERSKTVTDVEVAQLEQEQKRKIEETDKLKVKVSELEAHIGKRGELIEQMRTKTSESEASLIAFKERVRALEAQLEKEKERSKDALEREDKLVSELEEYKVRLADTSEEEKETEVTSQSLDDIKGQLVVASSQLDEEREDREKAESQISRLRSDLQKVGRDLETDITALRDEKDRYQNELEEERERRTKLEEELKALTEKFDDAETSVSEELKRLKIEGQRLLKETEKKEKNLEAEVLELNIQKEEMAQQRALFEKEWANLEEERTDLEELRSRAEQKLTENDSRLKEGFDHLEKERDILTGRAGSLTDRERRLISKEHALKQKEQSLRSELRSMALGLQRPAAPATGPEEGTTPHIDIEPDPEPSKNGTLEERGEKDAEMILERIRTLSPTRIGHEEEQASVGSPVEEEASPPPRIWPPLGSVKERHTVKEQMDIEPHPRQEPRTERPLHKEKEPTSVFVWPDSAYEAEARWDNKDHYHDASGAHRPVSTKRRMLTQYVTVKNEPEERSRQKFFRCACGTEILLTEEHRRQGLTCPHCGRKLL